jgi:hypothetical protein
MTQQSLANLGFEVKAVFPTTMAGFIYLQFLIVSIFRKSMASALIDLRLLELKL